MSRLVGGSALDERVAQSGLVAEEDVRDGALRTQGGGAQCQDAGGGLAQKGRHPSIWISGEPEDVRDGALRIQGGGRRGLTLGWYVNEYHNKVNTVLPRTSG